MRQEIEQIDAPGAIQHDSTTITNAEASISVVLQKGGYRPVHATSSGCHWQDCCLSEGHAVSGLEKILELSHSMVARPVNSLSGHNGCD